MIKKRKKKRTHAEVVEAQKLRTEEKLRKAHEREKKKAAREAAIRAREERAKLRALRAEARVPKKRDTSGKYCSYYRDPSPKYSQYEGIVNVGDTVAAYVLGGVIIHGDVIEKRASTEDDYTYGAFLEKGAKSPQDNLRFSIQTANGEIYYVRGYKIIAKKGV